MEINHDQFKACGMHQPFSVYSMIIYYAALQIAAWTGTFNFKCHVRLKRTCIAMSCNVYSCNDLRNWTSSKINKSHSLNNFTAWIIVLNSMFTRYVQKVFNPHPSIRFWWRTCHLNSLCCNAVLTFFVLNIKLTGVNCSVLFCVESKVCVKRKNLFYCDETKDDDDDDLSRSLIFWRVNIGNIIDIILSTHITSG
jgi:hypothetical protein